MCKEGSKERTMLSGNDPFEQFKARKEVERLEKKIKTGAAVRCPSGADDSGTLKKLPKAVTDTFVDRSWIY